MFIASASNAYHLSKHQSSDQSPIESRGKKILEAQGMARRGARYLHREKSI